MHITRGNVTSLSLSWKHLESLLMSNTFKIETNISVHTHAEVYRLPEMREVAAQLVAISCGSLLHHKATEQFELLLYRTKKKKKRWHIHNHAVADAFYPVDGVTHSLSLQ